MKFNRQKIKNELRRAGVLVFCNLVLAFLVNAFIIPHDIIVGGATGVGILVSKLLPLDTATVVLIFNILMLILGGAVLGKQFFLTTVAGSLIYPVFLSMFQQFPVLAQLTDDPLAAVLIGGGLLGLSVGLLMRIGSSSGGTDVLNLVMSRWFHVPVAVTVYIVDLAIMAGQLLLGRVEGLLYGVILLVVETFVLNQVLVSGQTQFQVMAISEQYEALRHKLLTETGVGVTMVYIETGYVGRQQKGVLCVISKQKLRDVIGAIQQVDASAFVTVTQIKEVRGQGFTRARVPLTLETGAPVPEAADIPAKSL